MHAPIVPGVFLRIYSLSFCSSCKRCTQLVGSKVPFYGSKGKLINSFILHFECRLAVLYACNKTGRSSDADADQRKWQSVAFTWSEGICMAFLSRQVGSLPLPTMLNILLVLLQSSVLMMSSSSGSFASCSAL